MTALAPSPAPTTAPSRRTRWAGGSLVAGTVTLAAAAVLDPATPDGGLAEVMAYAGAHAGRWTLWAVLLVLTGLLLLPGVAALARTTRSRLVLVGACATGAGLVGLAGLGVAETVLPALADGEVTPEVLAAAQRVEESAGLGVSFVLLALGFYLGVPLLTWALRRAGVVPLWVPVAATVGQVASWLASEAPNTWEAVARVPVLLALLALGGVLLRGGRQLR